MVADCHTRFNAWTHSIHRGKVNSNRVLERWLGDDDEANGGEDKQQQ